MDTPSSNKENAHGTRRQTESSSIGGSIRYRWLDAGRPEPDGRIFHDEVLLTINLRSFVVRTGDTVLLFSNETDRDWPCRIENMWQPENSHPSPVMFTARWFCNAAEIQTIQHGWEGCLGKDELVQQMSSHHVVLSNQTDENEIASLEGPCHVQYCHPKDVVGQQQQPRLLPKHFLCHYKLDIRDRSAYLLPLEAEELGYNRTLTEEQLRAMGVAPTPLSNATRHAHSSEYNSGGLMLT